MIPYLLFPRFFKLIGLLLVMLGYTIDFIKRPNLLDVTNGLGLLVQILVLIGLLFICCSKQKTEDELIKYYRLISLQWAVLILIMLRVFYKTMAWAFADESWTPHWQINALLIFYLLFFYYQLYVKDFIANMFNKTES